jgi:hypothetical protein
LTSAIINIFPSFSLSPSSPFMQPSFSQGYAARKFKPLKIIVLDCQSIHKGKGKVVPVLNYLSTMP